jgi:hypothetical protein
MAGGCCIRKAGTPIDCAVRRRTLFPSPRPCCKQHALCPIRAACAAPHAYTAVRGAGPTLIIEPKDLYVADDFEDSADDATLLTCSRVPTRM